MAALPKNQLGVALSGSGFLLGAHIGALQAVEQAGFTITEIAGTSGGAIVAANYAAGVSAATLREQFMTTDFRPLLNIDWLSPLRLVLRHGLCNPKPLTAWLQTHLGGMTMNGTKIPCTLISTDISAEAAYIWNAALTGACPLWQAALASATVPALYPPVSWQGKFLQDGSLTDDVPVAQLTAPRRLAVVLHAKPVPLTGKLNLAGLLTRDVAALYAAGVTDLLVNAQKTGAIIAYVDATGFSAFNTDLTQDARATLIDIGYRATQNALKCWMTPTA
jgi:NTE family protein